MTFRRLLLKPQMVWAMTVLAIAFGLVAMHQLSSDHRAVDPEATSMAVTTSSTPTGDVGRQAGMVGDDHGGIHTGNHTGQHDLDSGCTGCGGHHGSMIADCLAALLLLFLGAWIPARNGWLFRPPRSRRGLPMAALLRRWIRPAPRLEELSICRT